MKSTKSYMAKPSEVTPQWVHIDATGKTLGRLAVDIARLLQGKHRPTYTPHILTGDYVVVTNAAKVRVTGRKLEQKLYYRHSGYVGHLKATPLKSLLQQHPERVLQLAVKGMLPKNKLGREMLRRFKVYAAEEHPHQSQLGQS
ncbi:MAG: 50S ribosomal protein L13 [Dehalococcoidia bacterium]